MQVGRITGLPEPMDWKQTGDQVQITGRFAAGSVNAARIARDQLLGYHLNPDEPVIPIIPAADDRLTGFYRILAVDVPTTPVMLITNGIIDYVIHAQRLGAYKTAYMESFLTGALRVGGGAFAATAEPFHAYPNVAWEYTNGVTGFTVEDRPVADGSTTVKWVRMNPSGAAPVYKALARFAVDPVYFYNGACQLVSTTPASHTVVGQQDAPGSITWTLSNGLVSVFWKNSDNDFDITWADSTHTYRSGAKIVFAHSIPGATWLAVIPLDPIKIIRNAPEECIIRIFQQSQYTTLPIYCDVSIRRGSRIVRFMLNGAYSDAWTFRRNGSLASTALANGSVTTANDGNGNRNLILSAAASTNDLVNGWLTLNATSLIADCACSMELGGTGSVNRDTALSQEYQYFAAQAERMQVVGR